MRGGKFIIPFLAPITNPVWEVEVVCDGLDRLYIDRLIFSFFVRKVMVLVFLP